MAVSGGATCAALGDLRAAGREFRVRGFAETGMRDIAAAAALPRQISTTYFKASTTFSSFARITP